jgi:hypothetical protein
VKYLKSIVCIVVTLLAVAEAATPASIDVSQGTSRVELKKKYIRPAEIPFPAENVYSKDKELLGPHSVLRSAVIGIALHSLLQLS